MKKTFSTISLLLQDTPVFWVTLAFAIYFFYAQFVVTVSWNAIELIIAQHLLDHGTYATSIDYPSALTLAAGAAYPTGDFFAALDR